MLSKIAERNPIPKVVCHEGTGRFSTGISEAALTKASRKIEPRKARGSRDQFDERAGTTAAMAIHVAAPTNGKRLICVGYLKLTKKFVPITTSRINATKPTRSQSTSG